MMSDGSGEMKKWKRVAEKNKWKLKSQLRRGNVGENPTAKEYGKVR
jgi:hypothetical protein